MVNQTEIYPKKKEIFKYSLYNYIGAFIGIFSTLFIYTTNQEFLGVIRYVESLSYVIWPIILLGGSSSLINFSGKFSKDINVKLFSFTLMNIVRNSFIFFFFVYFGFEIFSKYFKLEFIYFASVFAVFLAGIDLLKRQLSIHNKIAFPSVLDNFFPKLMLPFIFILYYFNHIHENKIGISIYIISYTLIFMVLFLYGSKINAFKITTQTKSIFNVISRKEYYRYSLFALAGSLGYLFVFKLDSLMIPNLISYKANGVYSIATVAASIIFIPARGMFTLYAPKVSKLIKNEDFIELNILYKDVAKSLLFIGLLIYSCIFFGVKDIFQLLPSNDILLQTVSVIFIIGMTSVFNMATGFNSEIIIYSKYYKFNIIALSTLTIINLISNYTFIVVFNWGIEGAALASFLSIVIFNLLKVWFVYFYMGLLPFDFSFFKILIIQFILILFFFLLPDLSSPFNFIFKIFGVLFCQLILIYKLKLVLRYNLFINEIFAKLQNNIV